MIVSAQRAAGAPAAADPYLAAFDGVAGTICRTASRYQVRDSPENLVKAGISVTELVVSGSYNLGVKAGAGLRGLGTLLTTGSLDAAVETIRSTQAEAGWELKSDGAREADCRASALFSYGG